MKYLISILLLFLSFALPGSDNYREIDKKITREWLMKKDAEGYDEEMVDFLKEHWDLEILCKHLTNTEINTTM